MTPLNKYINIISKYSLEEEAAMIWWSTLNENEKNFLSRKVFGDPEFWEDGELGRMDIYKIYKLKNK